jgi:hypothetical protein
MGSPDDPTIELEDVNKTFHIQSSMLSINV